MIDPITRLEAQWGLSPLPSKPNENINSGKAVAASLKPASRFARRLSQELANSRLRILTRRLRTE